MNPGTQKAILQGDDRAAQSALKSEWSETDLFALWKVAHAAGNITRAQMISRRLDQIRGS